MEKHTAYTKCNRWRYIQTVEKGSIPQPGYTRTNSYWPGGTDWVNTNGWAVTPLECTENSHHPLPLSPQWNGKEKQHTLGRYVAFNAVRMRWEKLELYINTEEEDSLGISKQTDDI